MRYPWSAGVALGLLTAAAWPADREDGAVRYGIGSWPETFGNHRAVVRIDTPAEAVRCTLPWRRRDPEPDRKAVWVTDAAGARVRNVAVLAADAERGELVFQPVSGPGVYHVYYLPFRYEGWWPFPTTRYAAREETAEAAWVGQHRLGELRPGSPEWERLPRAELVEFQAIDEFHRRDPMELPATAAELKGLRAAHAGEPFLLFPEDRRFPIRMEEAIPLRWVERGPGRPLEGEACRGEFYAFQVGVYAWRDALSDVRVSWTGLTSAAGGSLPASAVRCLNTGGTDWLGSPWDKTVAVPAGAVRALWFGVAVPENAAPGVYEGSVTVAPAGLPPRRAAVLLRVREDTIAEAGDHDLWRQSRLRWLDSTIGLDDEVFDPFTPVRWDAASATAFVLGRAMQAAPGGLPAAVRSTFTASIDSAEGPPREILARPVRFVVSSGGAEIVWSREPVQVVKQTSGGVWWRSRAAGGGLTLSCEAGLECDGYADYRLTLRSETALALDNAVLEIPFRADAARYMIGMGREGGLRPPAWDWAWDLRYANNHLWLGDVNAGLQCKLKNATPHWGLYGLQDCGLYRDWAGEGKGGCSLREEGDTVVVRAFTGPLHAAAGQELHFNFGLLITPLRVLDRQHWRWRYFHQSAAEPVDKVIPTGATVINLHQGDALNPHINYPFVTADRLAAYAREAHAAGLKVKIYYTVRELSNYAAEFWALRSLGDEIFRPGAGALPVQYFREQDPKRQDGPPTGSSWLCEHVIRNYAPAWHQPLGNAHYDAALAQQGLSRWHNYYLEGLRYLIRHVGIDGLYLDGIGYDRQVMKRVRKVMQRARPGCLIDFHSGNNFAPEYGLNNVAGQYMELFPCIDSLWFGEGFDYGRPPDYWLVEISGIPFGLFGEMLQGGGNPWRGMVYGMTNRLGWGGDPRPLWKLWDEFGIDTARMAGYWDPACPVRTDREDVLATAYVRRDPQPSCLVALASWAPETAAVSLAVDWAALGLTPDRTTVYAPAIPRFQREALWRAGDPIPVLPGRGWLLVLAETPRDLPQGVTRDPFASLQPESRETFAGESLPPGWEPHLSAAGDAALATGGGLQVEAPANHVAYARRPLPPGAVAVRCLVDPGTDRGATWGPGLALQWPDGRALRINLRAEGRFGVYGHGAEVLEGQWFPGERCHLAIVLTGERVDLLAAADGTPWETLCSVPRSAFPGAPEAVLVGKMGVPGVDTDFTDPGPAGRCRILEVGVFAPAHP